MTVPFLRLCPLMLVLLAWAAPLIGAEKSVATAIETAPAALDDAARARIAADAAALLALGDRAPGSPSASAAAGHLADALRPLCAEVWVQRSTLPQVTAPEASLSGPFGQRPVAVLTAGAAVGAPIPVTGPLLRCDDEASVARRRLDLAGALVVLGPGSGRAWVTAVSAGAAAIVIEGGRDLTRNDLEALQTTVSLPVPRVVLDGVLPPGDQPTATLTATPRSHSAVALTIAGRIPGTQGPDANGQRPVVVLASGYEGPGTLAGLAFGATRAWNAALLLELARGFAAHPVRPDLLIVFHGARSEFFQGYRQLLVGGSEYLGETGDRTRHQLDTDLGLEATVLDLEQERIRRALWRVGEAEADLRHWADGGSRDPEALLARLARSDTAQRDDAAVASRPYLVEHLDRLLLPLLVLLLAIGLWRSGRLGQRGLVGMGVGLAGAVVWALAVPVFTVRGSSGQEQRLAREVALRMIGDRAAAHSTELMHAEHDARMAIPRGATPSASEAAAISALKDAREAWRNLQQKLGRKELKPVEAALLPEAVAEVLDPTRSDGGLARHRQILGERLADLESTAAIAADWRRLGLRLRQGIGIDLSDGGARLSAHIGGFYGVNIDKLTWLNGSLRRHAESLGGLVPWDASPQLNSRNSPDNFRIGREPSENDVGGLVVDHVVLGTVNDLRPRLGAPADDAARFGSDIFFAQATGLPVLLQRHLASDDAQRQPNIRRLKFRSPTVRAEATSEGSSTGRSGLPFPLVELAFTRGRLEAPRWIGDVRPAWRVWGDGFGMATLPWLPMSHPGRNRDGLRLSVVAYGAEGAISQVLSAEGAHKTNKPSDLAISNRSGITLDSKPVLFPAQAAWTGGLLDPRLLINLRAVKVLNAAGETQPQSLLTEIDTEAGLAVAWTPPGNRLRILGSEGAIGNRMLLLGGAAGLPGSGPAATAPVERAAEDVWALNEQRLTDLRRAGVTPRALVLLHADSERHLLAARAAISSGSVTEAVAESQAAWSLSSRAYGGVLGTANDVIKGLVVLLLLAIPAAVVAERLFISGRTIGVRVGGFVTFFLGIFGFLWICHPAFRLAAAPIIIFLAFAIIVMSGLVIWILYARFEDEMKRIRMSSLGLHTVDISRLGTLLATAALGVANMRRRPLRTALTAITVMLMTFILLTFAGFNPSAGVRSLSLGQAPRHNGLLIHQPGWLVLPEGAYERLASAWGERFHLHPVRWIAGDAEIRILPVDGPGGTALLEGVLCIGDNHPSRIDRALRGPDGGAGFADGRDLVFLTPGVQKQLGVQPGQRLRLRGLSLRVATLVDEVLLATGHLDGTPITPLAPPSDEAGQGSAEQRREQMLAAAASGQASETGVDHAIHLAPEAVAVVHVDTAKILGATLRGVTMLPRDQTIDLPAAAEEMAGQLAFPIRLGAAGDTRLVSSVGRLDVSGLGDVLVPLILGGLIIFSTMLGSVAERGREIFIYASLGLAPIHVGTLFLVEAAIYAIVGGMGGYLLAQGLAAGLGLAASFGLGVAPDLNYSGFTAAITILLVMATVLLSALYPAIMAGKAANPGRDREFRLGQPEGDLLAFTFPFTVAARDAGGLLTFLRTWFEAHTEASTACFTAADAQYLRDGDTRQVSSTVWLAPFDLGLSQSFRLVATPTDVPAIHGIRIEMRLRSGQRSAWTRVLPPFLKELRQQFLVWRVLDEATTARYRTLAGETPPDSTPVMPETAAGAPA